MATLIQKTGFARWQVLALASQLGVDTHAAFIGSEISDKLIVSLAEMKDKLDGASLAAAKTALVVIDGAERVFVWKAKVNGDVYSRNVGAHDVRGSLALLRSIYGAQRVSVTDENGARKILAQKKADRGTLAFYGLSHLIAKAEKKSEAKKNGATNKAKKNGARVVVTKKTTAKK